MDLFNAKTRPSPSSIQDKWVVGKPDSEELRTTKAIIARRKDERKPGPQIYTRSEYWNTATRKMTKWDPKDYFNQGGNHRWEFHEPNYEPIRVQTHAQFMLNACFDSDNTNSADVPKGKLGVTIELNVVHQNNGEKWRMGIPLSDNAECFVMCMQNGLPPLKMSCTQYKQGPAVRLFLNSKDVCELKKGKAKFFVYSKEPIQFCQFLELLPQGFKLAPPEEQVLGCWIAPEPLSMARDTLSRRRWQV